MTQPPAYHEFARRALPPPGAGRIRTLVKVIKHLSGPSRRSYAIEAAIRAAALDPLLDATPVKLRRQRKPRRPTLANVAEQANKAAIAVARYEVKPDGTIAVVTGTPESATPDNQWPLDEFRTKETKQ